MTEGDLCGVRGHPKPDPGEERTQPDLGCGERTQQLDWGTWLGRKTEMRVSRGGGSGNQGRGCLHRKHRRGGNGVLVLPGFYPVDPGEQLGRWKG